VRLGGAFDHALQRFCRLVPHHHAELIDDRALRRLGSQGEAGNGDDNQQDRRDRNRV
jgi:hypothetical protein